MPPEEWIIRDRRRGCIQNAAQRKFEAEKSGKKRPSPLRWFFGNLGDYVGRGIKIYGLCFMAGFVLGAMVYSQLGEGMFFDGSSRKTYLFISALGGFWLTCGAIKFGNDILRHAMIPASKRLCCLFRLLWPRVERHFVRLSSLLPLRRILVAFGWRNTGAGIVHRITVMMRWGNPTTIVSRIFSFVLRRKFVKNLLAKIKPETRTRVVRYLILAGISPIVYLAINKILYDWFVG